MLHLDDVKAAIFDYEAGNITLRELIDIMFDFCDDAEDQD